jgi:LmbE family N-acetylglucosaminyl deacetylase
MESIDKLLNKIEKKRLLIVFPHPDDETVMTSGLILRAKRLGWKIIVVCLTKGEGGRIHIHPKGRSLAEIRTAELNNALKILKVDEVRLFDYGDGRLRLTRGWKQKLPVVLNAADPGLVVSYDMSGVSGHPDHVILAAEIFNLMKKKKKVLLLWPAFVGEMKSQFINKEVADNACEAEWELKLNLIESLNKWRALRCHNSQKLGKHKMFFRWLFLRKMSKVEYFGQADFGQKYSHKYVEFK